MLTSWALLALASGCARDLAGVVVGASAPVGVVALRDGESEFFPAAVGICVGVYSANTSVSDGTFEAVMVDYATGARGFRSGKVYLRVTRRRREGDRLLHGYLFGFGITAWDRAGAVEGTGSLVVGYAATLPLGQRGALHAEVAAMPMTIGAADWVVFHPGIAVTYAF